MEIKDTLLMPKTAYPMKGNLTNKEPELEQEWKEQDIYNKVLTKNAGKKPFYLHDGPPYANGELHLGHALNKILKDIIIRSKNMSGYYAPIILGWDTHGLPIENALGKNKKIKIRDLSTNELRDLCKDYALKQVAGQKEQFMRLGILADETSKYVTLAKEYEAEQIRVFAKMIKNEMIFKGLKPVYWSPSSHSALAEAEIEYQDKKSPAIYVGFEIKDEELNDVKAVIWTTTPWTIPANQGIAVGPKIMYVILQTEKGRFLIAKDLIEDFINNLEIVDYTVEKEILGQDLEHKKIIHPLNQKEFKIMLGSHVTNESGTGCVHTAPGHGEDDFIVGKNYNLEVLAVVDAYGKMINTQKYDGMFYEDANKEIGQDLEASGALLKLSFIKHSYPHDWRTKKPVIFRATDQWFASIDKDKAGMLDAIKNVNWINAWGEKRLYNMIKDRGEWCISRQRKWGVPIPIIYNEDETPIFDQEVLEHIAQLFEQYGSNIWFEKEAKELLPQGYKNPASPNGQYTKETDIMDVWFDSGVSHTAVMKKRLNVYQSDLYLEGSDQYRGWFNSSLITGYTTQQKAPYKSALSHGFVLDAKGNKMSKSLGNTITPKQIYQKYGADVLRLWVGTVDYQSDVRVSDEIIRQVTEIYRRIRNSFRFILGNLNDGTTFKESDMLTFDNLNIGDQYILITLDNLNQKAQKYYENYEFKKIIDVINTFITTQLSAFYFDYIKDVLYIQNADSQASMSIKTVLLTVFKTLVKLLSPVIPHTTAETWNYLYEGSVFLEDFEAIKNLTNEEVTKKIQKIITLRDLVNKEIEEQRNAKVLGKSLEAKVTLKLTKEYEELATIKNLALYLIVSKVEILPETAQELAIKVVKYSECNCVRCWKYYQEEELNEAGLCNSCLEILGKK
ncbi:MAG: isoleucine--tRNA ligase [Mycoplasmatales bacterium]